MGDINTDIKNILSNLKVSKTNIDDVVKITLDTLEQFHNIDVNKLYPIIIDNITSYLSEVDNDDNNDYDMYNSNFNKLVDLENELKFTLEEVQNQKLEMLRQHVLYLQTVNQPEQRSAEWYEMRKHMCTASDIGAILNLSKYSKRKDIILKKCGHGKPFIGNKFTFHGQCYEDVAIGIYESRKNSKVIEFGLIQHPTFPIVGASPDGITTDGVMLEIKCPYTRQLNGNIMDPKTFGYWVQIQIQLEVCNLNECDFFEAQIIEYKYHDMYYNDIYIEENVKFLDIIPSNNNLNYIKIPNDRRTHQGLEKGIIGKIYNTQTDENEYLYPPFLLSTDEQLEWLQLKKQNINHPRMYVENVYWKLLKSSNVRVKRDKEWFLKHKQSLSDFWDEVLKRRVSGVQDLLPKPRKRQKPKTIDQNKCLLLFSDSDTNNLTIKKTKSKKMKKTKSNKITKCLIDFSDNDSD